MKIMKNMEKIILIAALLTPFSLAAQPSSQVAWTAEQLNFVKAGDPQKGKTLAQTCNACHGESGISGMANTPSLAGQLPTYLYKQLQDYTDDNRQQPIMSALAKILSKQDVADVAAWFGSLPSAFQSSSSIDYESAEKLVKNGDSTRQIPPCEVCHANGGQGQKIDMPALYGQNADYISSQLKAFRDSSRHNDIYSRMRLIAKNLSDVEIIELGLYYQNLKK
jgi:cytochrome c553